MQAIIEETVAIEQLNAMLEEESFYESDNLLFQKIAEDIYADGYSINRHALPVQLARNLKAHLDNMNAVKFELAGIGRDQAHEVDTKVRSDEICWINGDSMAGRQWLAWCAVLQRYLNRRLFLGLFSFESHFAHYSPGDFYKRHLDAFKGQTNRVLSLVVYLNNDWPDEAGGELVLYRSEEDQHGINVKPDFATVAVFLSEEFPHEVLPATQDRYSIAGWFRVNTSTAEKVDPPN